MIAIMQVTAEGDSAGFRMPVGVDIPQSSQSPVLAEMQCHLRSCETREGYKFLICGYHLASCERRAICLQFNHGPLHRAQIGRILMTVLRYPSPTKLRSRGRHRTGVPALQLIASRKPAAVNAPVCGNCSSINLSAHEDPGFGDYFVCEDCMTQLDTDGSRL